MPPKAQRKPPHKSRKEILRDKKQQATLDTASRDLFDAIQKQDLQKVIVLLQKHDNVANQKNAEGMPAIHISAAVKKDQAGATATEIIDYLLFYGAKINDKDKNDSTALHIAAHHGNIAVVRMLISEDKEYINAQNNEGLTPLHYATKNCNIEVMKELLSAGSNVNKHSNDGSTVLHIAAKYSTPDIIDLLMKYKPDISIKNSDGKTAFDLFEDKSTIPQNFLNCMQTNLSTKLNPLIENRDTEKAIELINSNEFNPNHQDNNNYFPLTIALHKHNTEVAKALLCKGAMLDPLSTEILANETYSTIATTLAQFLLDKADDSCREQDLIMAKKMSDIISPHNTHLKYTIYSTLALYYCENNRYADALQLYKHALYFHPMSFITFDTYILIGDIHHTLGEYEHAIKNYKLATCLYYECLIPEDEHKTCYTKIRDIIDDTKYGIFPDAITNNEAKNTLLNLTQTIKNPIHKAMTHSLAGNLCTALKEYREAADNFIKAYQSNNNKYHQYKLHEAMIELYNFILEDIDNTGATDEAIALINKDEFNPNHAVKDKLSPLTIALNKKNIEIAEALLLKGTKLDQNSLEMLRQESYTEITKNLVKFFIHQPDPKEQDFIIAYELGKLCTDKFVEYTTSTNLANHYVETNQPLKATALYLELAGNIRKSMGDHDNATSNYHTAQEIYTTLITSVKNTKEEHSKIAQKEQQNVKKPQQKTLDVSSKPIEEPEAPSKSLTPKDLAKILLQNGIGYFNSENYDDAIACFKNALKHNPDNAACINYLGRAYYEQDNLVEAIKHFEQAILLDNKSPAYHLNLAHAYYYNGNPQQAEEEYKTAASLSARPEYHDAYAEILLELHPDSYAAMFVALIEYVKIGNEAKIAELLSKIKAADVKYLSLQSYILTDEDMKILIDIIDNKYTDLFGIDIGDNKSNKAIEETIGFITATNATPARLAYIKTLTSDKSISESLLANPDLVDALKDGVVSMDTFKRACSRKMEDYDQNENVQFDDIMKAAKKSFPDMKDNLILIDMINNPNQNVILNNLYHFNIIESLQHAIATCRISTKNLLSVVGFISTLGLDISNITQLDEDGSSSNLYITSLIALDKTNLIGQREKSYNLLLKTLAKKVTNLTDKLEIAKLCDEHKLYDISLLIAKEIVEQQNDNHEALYYLANAYSNMSDYKEALKACGMAKDLTNPKQEIPEMPSIIYRPKQETRATVSKNKDKKKAAVEAATNSSSSESHSSEENDTASDTSRKNVSFAKKASYEDDGLVKAKSTSPKPILKKQVAIESLFNKYSQTLDEIKVKLSSANANEKQAQALSTKADTSPPQQKTFKKHTVNDDIQHQFSIKWTINGKEHAFDNSHTIVKVEGHGPENFYAAITTDALDKTNSSKFKQVIKQFVKSEHRSNGIKSLGDKDCYEIKIAKEDMRLVCHKSYQVKHDNTTYQLAVFDTYVATHSKLANAINNSSAATEFELAVLDDVPISGCSSDNAGV